MNFDNEAQLKSFLKKESERLGISILNTYNTFFSLKLLERISKIDFGVLAVKGSFSELAHLEEMIRPVTDIDLVSIKSHNDPLLILYRAMYESNDDLTYELPRLPKKTKTGIYKIPIVAQFGKIKHNISIDFMESAKTLYFQDYKRINPVFIDDKFFYITTPTIEEHMAEKLCIIAESNKSNVLNTRVKDFYDLYKLYGGKYDFEKVKLFFNKMIVDREKIDPNSLSLKHLNDEFIDSHQKLWEDMSMKYEFLDKSIDFTEAVETTKNVLHDTIKSYKLTR